MKKKIAALFGIAMTVICLCLAASEGNIANAEQKKPVLQEKKIETYTDSNEYVGIENFNIKAKYTYAVNKKNIADISNIMDCYQSSKNGKVSMGFFVKARKAGTVKVTVRETYKGKVKKVGTCTIKIKKPRSGVYISGAQYSVSKGYKFKLACLGFYEIDITGNANYQSSNPSVASITKDGIVSAKKEGTTTITVKQGTESKSFQLSVIDKKVKKEYADWINAIDALAKKKITDKNLISIFNQYTVLAKKEDQYEKYYNEDGGKDEEECYIEIPNIYLLDDIRGRIETFLNKKATVNRYGVSLDVVQISKLNAGSAKMNVKLGKKVTKYDVMAQELARQFMDNRYVKYNSSTKTDVIFSINDKQGNLHYYKGKVKVGQKSITAKYDRSIVTNYGGKIKKGTAYTYAIAEHKKGQFRTESIKAQ